MNRTARHLISALFLALPVAPVPAAPMLFFDGDFSFDADSGALSVNATVSLAQGIAMPLDLPGTLEFSALLTATASDAFFTQGFFGPNPIGPDLEVHDAGTELLLAANFISLVTTGFNGFDFGEMQGTLTPTGGLLLSIFGDPSTLLALQLNLNAPFGPDLFDADFGGNLDGSITSIPEPHALALAGALLLVLPWLRQLTA
jgi:hypothetical protein